MSTVSEAFKATQISTFVVNHYATSSAVHVPSINAAPHRKNVVVSGQKSQAKFSGGGAIKMTRQQTVSLKSFSESRTQFNGTLSMSQASGQKLVFRSNILNKPKFQNRSMALMSSLKQESETDNLAKNAQRLELEANLLIPKLRETVTNDFRSMNQNLSQIVNEHQYPKYDNNSEDEDDSDVDFDEEIGDEQYIASLQSYIYPEPRQLDYDGIEDIDNFFDYVLALSENKITTAQKILLMGAAQSGDLESKVDYLQYATNIEKPQFDKLMSLYQDLMSKKNQGEEPQESEDETYEYKNVEKLRFINEKSGIIHLNFKKHDMAIRNIKVGFMGDQAIDRQSYEYFKKYQTQFLSFLFRKKANEEISA